MADALGLIEELTDAVVVLDLRGLIDALALLLGDDVGSDDLVTDADALAVSDW